MPYIRQEDRIRAAKLPETPGELNYAITIMVQEFLTKVGITYATLSVAVGALECAKLELVRRVINPYEDRKCKENGDVY
jgi:Mn-containing catalase